MLFVLLLHFFPSIYAVSCAEEGCSILSLNCKKSEICSSASISGPLFITDLPTYITRFAINNNQVTSINAATFAQQQDLEILRLEDNNIIRLDPALFATLPKLRILVLSNNKLSELSKVQFDHNPNLQVLDLSDNVLKYIPADVFHNLYNLTHLIMTGNVERTAPTCETNEYKIESTDFIMAVDLKPKIDCKPCPTGSNTIRNQLINTNNTNALESFDKNCKPTQSNAAASVSISISTSLSMLILFGVTFTLASPGSLPRSSKPPRSSPLPSVASSILCIPVFVTFLVLLISPVYSTTIYKRIEKNNCVSVGGTLIDSVTECNNARAALYSDIPAIQVQNKSLSYAPIGCRFNLFLDPNTTAIKHVLTFHSLVQSSSISSSSISSSSLSSSSLLSLDNT